MRRAARQNALIVTLLFGWPFIITAVFFTLTIVTGQESIFWFILLVPALLVMFINTIVQCVLQSRHIVLMIVWLLLTLLLVPLLPTIACMEMISRGVFWG